MHTDLIDSDRNLLGRVILNEVGEAVLAPGSKISGDRLGEVDVWRPGAQVEPEEGVAYLEALPFTFSSQALTAIFYPDEDVQKWTYRADQPRDRHGKWKSRLLPIRPYMDPPGHLATDRERKAGGFSAVGITNTKIGDDIEDAIVGYFGVEGRDDFHPGGKRQHPFDIRDDGDVYEVKARLREAKEYKAGLKAKEVEEKEAWAKKHGYRANTMIVVHDTQSGLAHLYSRPGVGAWRLPLIDGHLNGWRYHGAIPYHRLASMPMRKADREVTDAMKERAKVLARQLEGEIENALRNLGEEAANAYMQIAQKAEDPEQWAERLLQMLNLPTWIRNHLLPVLRNAAARTIADTEREVAKEAGIDVVVGPEEAKRITDAAGKDLNVADIEPQVRKAIMAAVAEGLQHGENPITTAHRIRSMVPPGRFTKAGSKYRAQLIARNETAIAQRESILAAYKSNPHVVAVKLRDGVYGPPRSDQKCMARDGEEVPIANAAAVVPYHPLCTLSFNPVVE